MSVKVPSDDDRRAAKASRAANIAGTRATTRPGSESTYLHVGDKVRVHRQAPRLGTWGRYDGREGWVASINTQRFPSGVTYTEVGVTWTDAADVEKVSADVWFRTDEVHPWP